MQKFFGTSWQPHKDISSYAQELEPRIFRNYYKFAIVRNPWDRIVSDYNYQKRKRSQAEHRLFMRNERGNTRSFSQWMEVVLSNRLNGARTLAKESIEEVSNNVKMGQTRQGI